MDWVQLLADSPAVIAWRSVTQGFSDVFGDESEETRDLNSMDLYEMSQGSSIMASGARELLEIRRKKVYNRFAELTLAACFLPLDNYNQLILDATAEAGALPGPDWYPPQWGTLSLNEYIQLREAFGCPVGANAPAAIGPVDSGGPAETAPNGSTAPSYALPTPIGTAPMPVVPTKVKGGTLILIGLGIAGGIYVVSKLIRPKTTKRGRKRALSWW